MALTVTYSGTMQLILDVLAAFSVDATGGQRGKVSRTITLSASGGTAPTVSGFLVGTLSVTGAQDILLAHATDPLQSAGDATYSSGFTVASTKIKAIWIRNTHATAALTVARGAANGCPIFDAAGDAVTLLGGGDGLLLLTFPAGTAALTTGSNDKLTLTPSTGTVTAEIMVIYGP